MLPGAVDAHVHCLSNPGEGIATATRSAAAGGITSIVEMPYDSGEPVNNTRTLEAKKAKVEREACVDVALLATVSPGTGARDVGDLVAAGACGFKLSLFDTDPQRFPRIPDDQLLEVLAAITSADSMACIHAENDEIIKSRIERSRRDGRTSPLDHCRSRPAVSETEAVLRAAEFARSTATRLHLCHLSLRRSLELVRWYRNDGLNVSAETCPHFLYFTEDDMLAQAGRLKMNPPLRTHDDREALWRGVRDGDVTFVASDHAPWSLTDKMASSNIFENHSGVPGVETLVPVVLGEGLKRGIPIEILSRVLMTEPARRFRLPGKGVLAPGYDADILIYDPDRSHLIDETNLHSNAGWSPYNGQVLRGEITLVLLRGEIAWDGELRTSPGRGRVLLPEVAT